MAKTLPKYPPRWAASHTKRLLSWWSEVWFLWTACNAHGPPHQIDLYFCSLPSTSHLLEPDAFFSVGISKQEKPGYLVVVRVVTTFSWIFGFSGTWKCSLFLVMRKVCKEKSSADTCCWEVWGAEHDALQTSPSVFTETLQMHMDYFRLLLCVP